jgi:hypothetical protein
MLDHRSETIESETYDNIGNRRENIINFEEL